MPSKVSLMDDMIKKYGKRKTRKMIKQNVKSSSDIEKNRRRVKK